MWIKLKDNTTNVDKILSPFWANSLPIYCPFMARSNERAKFGYIVTYLLLLAYLFVSQHLSNSSTLIGSQGNAVTLIAPIYIALNYRISDRNSVAPRSSHSKKSDLQSNSTY